MAYTKAGEVEQNSMFVSPRIRRMILILGLALFILSLILLFSAVAPGAGDIQLRETLPVDLFIPPGAP